MASEQESGEWPLKRLLSEVVGSGPKSAEDMTRAQATGAFERVLRGEPDPTTLGAFWLANRWKKNTPTELAAYRDVMARDSVASMAPECDPVDCGANYDGKGRTALLGVAAGLVAAGAGTPVVVHSGDRVPSGEGVAYKHVLDELGVETDLDPAASAAMTDDVGFGFYYQPNFNPGVHGLLDRRKQMGVRTFVNTVETLANPARADVHLGSFYHLSFAKKLTETVATSETAEFSRVLLFQGLEGYDDVRPGSTTVAEWDGDALEDFTIETEAYGMAVENADLEVADVAADSARITAGVLAGERTDAFADAVALNAALRLYAAEDVADIEEGIAVARETIETGAAAETLADLRAFSP
ncbi:anthranilate phosphoribosyltransferase [Halarchaeum nitratireducens]|uniref:Anthranilate phosphoribosyltransferase n=1 Tax=Halarchaeum nitratireducens TaxID=489913 RepID=A0A830G821_9EURY|nr:MULTISPECIES: anthranilate phosphoribosyltransferase [Halarchaeum]MBP2251458.1 anthranilate phosphoribosyltransferase [Halarchaeum solikamskense]GGN07221.1 anthranilate phosphoribosyltransferase [Halarchaeum nitratireducens]